MPKKNSFKFVFTFFLIAVITGCAGGKQESRARKHHFYVDLSEEEIKTEIEFGREVAAKILNNYPLSENRELTLYLNLVARSMALHSNRPELNYTVGILETPDVNAYAAPGGYIFVTSGAIKLMENEAELASVIAHEMIHINQKHIVKELKIKGKQSAGSGFVQLVAGTTEVFHVAFKEAIDNAMTILFKNGYAQKDEIEADSLGVTLAALTGYDPNALVSYFNRIKSGKSEKISSIFNLHPSFENRIKWIEKTIAADLVSSAEYKKDIGRFDEYTKK